MPALADAIREAITEGRYVFSDHADDSLADRRVRHWQVIAGMAEARVLKESARATPNPKAEFEVLLPDGTPV